MTKIPDTVFNLGKIFFRNFIGLGLKQDLEKRLKHIVPNMKRYCKTTKIKIAWYWYKTGISRLACVA